MQYDKFIYIDNRKKIVDGVEVDVGSDEFGDGTEEKPFRTIEKAREFIRYNKYTMSNYQQKESKSVRHK